MAKWTVYTPGKKPQYGAERWARYERLRSSGFNKQEARELSRISHPDDQRIIGSMIRTRRRLVSQFNKVAEENDWTPGQRAYHFNHGIRSWLDKQGVTSKSNPIMGLYHKIENRLARSKGWKPGAFDPSDTESERVRRRSKSKTPERKGRNRGQIKSQKARARARKAADRGISGQQTRGRSLELWEKDLQWLQEQRKTTTGKIAQRQDDRIRVVRQKIREARARRDRGENPVA